MNESEFDQFAAEYRRIHASSIRASGEGPEFFAEYKIADIYRMVLDGKLRAPNRILDFGAGVGGSVPYFKKYFGAAELACLDVSSKSLEIGRSRFGDSVNFVHYDGYRAPLQDEEFDLVFVACVLHHVPRDEHVALLSELRRMLSPGGSLIVYEHNPLNFLTVRAVNQCEFDKNAILIQAKTLTKNVEAAGFYLASLQYRLFFPRALRALRPLERFMGALPIGAQYQVHGVKQ